VDLDGEGLDATCAELVAEGCEVSGVTLDVTDSSLLQDLFAGIAKQHGGLDILVNCAGANRRGSVVELAEEDWDFTLRVNLTSIFLCCKYAIPLLIERGGGRIVNIASSAGLVPVAGAPAYCASKAGVVLLSKQITLDYSRFGVIANALCPTGVDTPWMARRFAAEPDAARARRDYESSAGPLLKPEAIANVVLFLVTDGLTNFPVPYVQ
jgi:NAD(P)-dependent dehydrogenase (short-subunit alcohol dehydrogenase family)